jgi:hypothetical protein
VAVSQFSGERAIAGRLRETQRARANYQQQRSQCQRLHPNSRNNHRQPPCGSPWKQAFTARPALSADSDQEISDQRPKTGISRRWLERFALQ